MSPALSRHFSDRHTATPYRYVAEALRANGNSLSECNTKISLRPCGDLSENGQHGLVSVRHLFRAVLSRVVSTGHG